MTDCDPRKKKEKKKQTKVQKKLGSIVRRVNSNSDPCEKLEEKMDVMVVSQEVASRNTQLRHRLPKVFGSFVNAVATVQFFVVVLLDVLSVLNPRGQEKDLMTNPGGGGVEEPLL